MTLDCKHAGEAASLNTANDWNMRDNNLSGPDSNDNTIHDNNSSWSFQTTTAIMQRGW